MKETKQRIVSEVEREKVASVVVNCPFSRKISINIALFGMVSEPRAVATGSGGYLDCNHERSRFAASDAPRR